MEINRVSLSAMPSWKYLLNVLIISSFFLQTQILVAQENRSSKPLQEAEWKTRLSPVLSGKATGYFKSGKEYSYTVEVRQLSRFLAYISRNTSGVKILRSYSRYIFVIRCSPVVLQRMMREDLLLSADEALLKPEQDGGVISFDHTVNAIGAAHHFFPLTDGAGQLVSVKENRMDTTDIDLAGRYRNTGVAATAGNTHATAMTTLIAGAGNSSFKGRGVAYRSRYTSSDFAGVLPDADELYRTEDIRVQNHSYGAAIQSWYGVNARAFDLSANSNPSLLHVFSSGNSGTGAPAEGAYAGISGYANLTGNMKMAKNILVVGAIDSALRIPAASSRGPAYDGRLKPEIVAFAEDGTSGSAALVSGAAVLLQQSYQEKNGIYAGADLIKALLVNSADDTGSPGPDFISGYGNMNLYRALLTVSDNRIQTGSLLPFSSEEYILSIPPGARNFKLTLAWNDPASEAFGTKALVNDIDLTIEKLSTGETWLPWVLNSSAHPDSLQMPALRKRDTLNNIEQVGIDEAGGQYKVTVRSSVLRSVRQAFALAWQFDVPDSFMWMAPLSAGKIQGGTNYYLRWHQTYPAGTKGELQWKISNQSVWESLQNQVSIDQQKISWQVPEEFSVAELRMIIGTDTIYSGSFTINPLPHLAAGWICDSILIYWAPSFPANQWRVYRLAGGSMQLTAEVKDTSIIVSKSGSKYLAVAPVIEGREGLRSETINIEQQGSGCYINVFLADLINEKEGRLTIQLGTVYGINNIRIIKIGNGRTELVRYSSAITNSYVYTDSNLQQGINNYQIEIELAGGNTILSQVETIYFSNNKPYIIFPNPVRRGEPVNLIQETVNDLECVLYDAAGRLIRKYILTDKLAVIPTSGLVAGWYYLVIYDEKKQANRYKIIVR